MSQYDRLRELLLNESFPHLFRFKFVGKNTTVFKSGVQELLNQFPRLQYESERPSKGNRHVAFGYTLAALSADEIIQVLDAISKIPDLVIML
jgi:putative lipoic acid-binding regulatory protein